MEKVIAQMFERTGLEIKELFSRDELADMIDEVVTEPPHTAILFGTFLVALTIAHSSYPLRNKQCNGNVYIATYGDTHNGCARIHFS